jgi:UDP-N-acetylmuramoyl-L-alanyl-D-glutamate--2,6-diaminopimelate ligase
MRLSQLVQAIGGEVLSCEPQGLGSESLVSAAQLDSRLVRPGHLFAALAGSQSDGLRFISDARRNGAVAVLSERAIDPKQAPLQWIHPEPARALGEACHLLQGQPTQHMKVIGITGTNGKTTTAHILAHILRQNGMQPGVVGTVGHSLAKGVMLPASHTTPGAPELASIAAQHRDLGGDSLVLELSSHALVQERHRGLEFDAAVFTNLTREHLDYHGDMGAYQAAKGRLFAALKPGARAIGNLDDHAWPGFAAMARERGAEVLTTSTRQRADLCASKLRMTPLGTYFYFQGMGISERKVSIPLCGRFNVENALAALGCALVAGVRLDHALDSLASCTPAPGRMEVLGAGGDPLHGASSYGEPGAHARVVVDGAVGAHARVVVDGAVGAHARVVVDYAHTPDALAQALEALRASQAESGRLICVFGCGGERDKGKRPLMGRVASQYADHLVVTNDNPRSEDPAEIAASIMEGVDSSVCEVELELDRELAIRSVLAPEILRDPTNTILVAGKGHETSQVDATGIHVFDDRALIREILQEVVPCRV